MLELASDLLPLLRAGESVAVVTVARVARSAPRGVGAAMAVTRSGRVIGSISGGCVEGDALALGLLCLSRGRGDAARFGFTDDEAFAAGLACGGSIDAVVSVVRPGDTATIAALDAAAAGRTARVGILTSGPQVGMTTEAAELPASAVSTGPDGAEVLNVVHRSPARLIVLGAGEHAAALCRVASAAGFAVTVCDVWDTLVTPERFPRAERLVTGLPHELLRSLDPGEIDERTAVCVLTHDERLDVPALEAALRLPVGFVGAMGARSTVAHRERRLREAGLGDEELARLHSPLGLDLGGASPDETALSVLAEIVAVRHGGTGMPLRERSGTVHRRESVDARVADASRDRDAPDRAVRSCAAPSASVAMLH